MFVYELFKKLNAKDIVNQMISRPGFFWDIDENLTIDDTEKKRLKEVAVSKYIEAVNEMQEKDYTGNNDEILILTKEYDDDEFFLEPCMLTREKFDEAYAHLTGSFEMENFDNPLYGICFETRDEVLSYTLSPVMLEMFSEEEIAAAILDEVTFFGIDEEYCNEKIEKNFNELQAQIDEIEKAKSEGREIGIPAEKVFEDLGWEDTRTEEEKEEMHKKIISDMNNRMEYIKEVVVKTIEMMR